MIRQYYHRCRGAKYSSHIQGKLANGATMICFLFQSRDAFYRRNARCRGGSQHKLNARSRSELMTTTLRKRGSVMLSKPYNKWDAGQLPKSGSRRSIPRRSASFRDARTSILTADSNRLIHTMEAFQSTSEQTPIALVHPTGHNSKSVTTSQNVN